MARTPQRPTDDELEQQIRRIVAHAETNDLGVQSDVDSCSRQSGIPVTRLAILGEELKRYLRAAAEAPVPPCGLVIEYVLEDMDLGEVQAGETRALMIAEVDRRAGKPTTATTFVAFLRMVALRPLMPLVRERAEGFFYRQRVPHDDIGDLGGEVIVRVLKPLEAGRPPHTNAGAFVAQVCRSVLFDYHRKAKRRRDMLGEEEDAGAQAVSNDCPVARAIENVSIDEIDDPKKKEIIILFRWGYSPKEIAARVERTVAEVRKVIRDYLERP